MFLWIRGWEVREGGGAWELGLATKWEDSFPNRCFGFQDFWGIFGGLGPGATVSGCLWGA